MKKLPQYLWAGTMLMIAGCGKKEEAPRPSAASGKSLSEKGPPPRVWSKAVVQYPGYPACKDKRIWSHHEISQRHRNLVMKDLPEYITELRGGAPIEETRRTSAAWFFNVPEVHREAFGQYLLELGVPVYALRETFSKTEAQLPQTQWPEKPADPPVKSLLFLQSTKAAGDSVIMGTKFGKSWDTMTYYLTNLNYTRASILITFAWKSGDVQICEKRAYDD